jgi:methylmalonyl-CoA/ethylmalonyl-CoA epimerase
MTVPEPPLPALLQQRELDHLAIAVTDLDEASTPWLLLGATLAAPDELVSAQQVRLRLLQFGTAVLELLESTSADGPVARFIASRGPGLHHVALRSSDLVQDMQLLAGQGLEFLASAPQPGRSGSLVAFIHPRSTGGVLVELVELPQATAAGVGLPV